MSVRVLLADDQQLIRAGERVQAVVLAYESGLVEAGSGFNDRLA